MRERVDSYLSFLGRGESAIFQWVMLPRVVPIRVNKYTHPHDLNSNLYGITYEMIIF